MAFLPIYKSAPKAALKDKALYQMLALVDAIRSGKARERNIALKQFKQRLSQFG